MGRDRDLHPCYDDDDDLLEEHVYSENILAESSVSETLDSVTASSDSLIHNTEISGDVVTHLEPVQVFCENEHDLGKVELSVDTNDLIPENNFDVSNYIPTPQYDYSFDTDLGTLEADDTELGFADLFNNCEHDKALLVSELGKTRLHSDIFEPKNECNLNASDSLPRTQYVAPLILLCIKQRTQRFWMMIMNWDLMICSMKMNMIYLFLSYGKCVMVLVALYMKTI
ncbi:uncharacterized protein LOC113287913 [Papaver somniferum]|uniref:uncharacterized protein LOC113287913 n=1 Tax=Papaver somniferum TaxID=3469 RepID=UPI000E70399C|nr:uncharacterized protein LOC113287913 [Papaver somniferum]